MGRNRGKALNTIRTLNGRSEQDELFQQGLAKLKQQGYDIQAVEIAAVGAGLSAQPTITGGSVAVLGAADTAPVEPAAPAAPAAPAGQAQAFSIEAIEAIVSNVITQNQQSNDAAIAAAQQEHQTQLAAAQQEHQTQLAALQRQLDAAIAAQQQSGEQQAATTAERDRIIQTLGLDRMIGQPPIGEQRSSGRVGRVTPDSPQGAVREYIEVMGHSGSKRKYSPKLGYYVAQNHVEGDRFIREHKREVLQSLEEWGRSAGLFGGASTHAATVIPNIPGGFLPALSGFMRVNHRSSHIFWQFINLAIDWEKNTGDTIQIPRSGFISKPTDPNQRRLSGGGTFINIDGGSQNLQTGVVPLVIAEWGLGADASAPPIGVPTFVSAHSLINLIQVLERNLLQDYDEWEDLVIRQLWSRTSRVVYNDRDEVSTSVATLAVGDGGTITEDYLAALFAYMRTLQIPTYQDGCYGIALNTVAWKQLKTSMGDRVHYQSTPDMEELANILSISTGNELGRVSGYVGHVGDFHVFETNATGVGGPSANILDGVRNELIAGSNRITRTSYAFGADTIARGISSPMEIRMDENGNFGRLDRYIWHEESGFAPMDVDPVGYNDTAAVPQQLRVIEVRNLDVPL